eukprot:GHVT01054734.1.p1 GENE.GHVT01054734.1~~GHVT01054734.1.p1  ORF type:complete len:632 (+),score=65.66 GHVT01054734.1:65-1960(+)
MGESKHARPQRKLSKASIHDHPRQLDATSCLERRAAVSVSPRTSCRAQIEPREERTSIAPTSQMITVGKKPPRKKRKVSPVSVPSTSSPTSATSQVHTNGPMQPSCTKNTLCYKDNQSSDPTPMYTPSSELDTPTASISQAGTLVVHASSRGGSLCSSSASDSFPSTSPPEPSGLSATCSLTPENSSASPQRVRSRSFASCGVVPWLRRVASSLNVIRPTPVQSAVLPHVLHGYDALATAPTGSGKTLVYAWPILQRLALDIHAGFALVLLPGRELAAQVADQFLAYGAPIGLRVCICVGGKDLVSQAAQLDAGPHAIIGTPGRVADHLTNPTGVVRSSLRHLRVLVLDEADRLLSPSFEENLSSILSLIPSASSGQRQTLLLSATLTAPLRSLVDAFPPARRMRVFDTNPTNKPLENLRQTYVFLPARMRTTYLAHMLLCCQAAETATRAGASANGASSSAFSQLPKNGLDRASQRHLNNREKQTKRMSPNMFPLTERNGAQQSAGSSRDVHALTTSKGNHDLGTQQAGDDEEDGSGSSSYDDPALLASLPSEAKAQWIIFTKTCYECQLLATTLEILGINVTALHALQNQRRLATKHLVISRRGFNHLSSPMLTQTYSAYARNAEMSRL